MVKYAILFGVLICVQAYMSFIQVKNYKKNVSEMRGSGILGVGARKGLLNQGQIVIISCERETQLIKECRIMGGITVFERFKRIKEYEGLTLVQLREIAIAEDLKINKRYRRKHGYNGNNPSKRDGALLQAVEAVQNRIIRDEEQRIKSLMLDDQA